MTGIIRRYHEANGFKEHKMTALNVGRPTTVYIREEIRQEIKRRGMTVTGAFQAGWEAIQNQVKYAARVESMETELADMHRNIRAYQRMLQDQNGAKK
jgi:hypothetical protein